MTRYNGLYVGKLRQVLRCKFPTLLLLLIIFFQVGGWHLNKDCVFLTLKYQHAETLCPSKDFLLSFSCSQVVYCSFSCWLMLLTRISLGFLKGLAHHTSSHSLSDLLWFPSGPLNFLPLSTPPPLSIPIRVATSTTKLFPNTWKIPTSSLFPSFTVGEPSHTEAGKSGQRCRNKLLDVQILPTYPALCNFKYVTLNWKPRLSWRRAIYLKRTL